MPQLEVAKIINRQVLAVERQVHQEIEQRWRPPAEVIPRQCEIRCQFWQCEIRCVKFGVSSCVKFGVSSYFGKFGVSSYFERVNKKAHDGFRGGGQSGLELADQDRPSSDRKARKKRGL